MTFLALPEPPNLTKAADLAARGFDQRDAEALSEAHRYLYALYADRVWRPAASERTPEQNDELWLARRTLEAGFRRFLDNQRDEAGFDPQPPGDVAKWFERLATDDHPLDSNEWGEHVRERATLDQMKNIVRQRSLFFLREPDPWIHAVPSLTGRAKAGLIDLLLDEYGWGKYERMHSSIYANLMQALGLNSEIDHYEGEASWQFLATLNHQWMCALDPALTRRLIGVVYLTEADSPAAMTNYLAAWERLGIDDENITEFYELHVHADENHRDVALQEVAVPVAEAEGPDAATEIALGIFDGRALEAEFARSELNKSRETAEAIT